MTDIDPPNIGTVKYRQQQKRHRMLVTASFALALIAVATLLYAASAQRQTGATIGPAVSIALATLFVGAMVAANWLYLRPADELAWANNVHAAFWGVAVTFLFYPAWLILWMGGLVPAPNAFILYEVMLVSTGAAYFWKSFR